MFFGFLVIILVNENLVLYGLGPCGFNLSLSLSPGIEYLYFNEPIFCWLCFRWFWACPLVYEWPVSISLENDCSMLLFLPSWCWDGWHDLFSCGVRGVDIVLWWFFFLYTVCFLITRALFVRAAQCGGGCSGEEPPHTALTNEPRLWFQICIAIGSSLHFILSVSKLAFIVMSTLIEGCWRRSRWCCLSG